MLAAYERSTARSSAGQSPSSTYNEVVIEATTFTVKLPNAVEAVYWHAGFAASEALARKMHQTFLQHFKLGDASRDLTLSQAHVATVGAPALLEFDQSDWEHPFRSARP